MYKDLNPKQQTKLSFIRHGWWSPVYELTDGNYNYGTLSYEGISRRYARVETAVNHWMFSFKDFFDNTIIITDQNGMLIGHSTREFLSMTRKVTLQSGFTAEFYRTSMWTREHIWVSPGYGKIMSITNGFPFTLKMDVYIDQTQTPQAIIPLLIFLGTHFTILRRRRKAAH